MQREEVVIYGAGELGRNTCDILVEKGKHVIAFLDKNAVGSVNGIPVYNPNSFQLRKQEVAVLICLSNGMLHKEVADELYHQGYNKIVFLPLGFCLGVKTRNELTHFYNRVLKGMFSTREILDYSEYSTFVIDENAVIRNEDGIRTVWMGQEIVFSENYWAWKGDFSKIHFINDGVSTNLRTNYWRHELFEFLDGKREDCNNYLSIFGCNDEMQKGIDIIKARERLYREFKRLLSFGMGSFIEMAPEVIWNQKGYFTIVGGHHRLIFLQNEGYVFLPVKILADDYVLWVNQEELVKIEKYIRDNNIRETYVPVPHPYFRNFPAVRELHGSAVIQSVLKYLGPKPLDEKKVIDISQYEGYFARCVSRMLAQEIKCYLKDKKEKGLAERIASLLRINNIEFNLIEELCQEYIQSANIIFAMKNVDILLENNMLKGFCGILFVEYNIKMPKVVEEILECSQLINYEPLYREVVDGELLEMGVVC